MISIVILTKDNEATLERTLLSVQTFSDIVLLDTGSTDRTLEIAKHFSQVQIHTSGFTGFGPLRNQGAFLARHDWILTLDSDEVLSPLLLIELQQTTLDRNTIYAFPFWNFYRDRHIKWCGWHPESHCRLYHRKDTEFSPDHVHEKLLYKSAKIHSFSYPIYHYPYRSQEDFLRKMQIYTSLFAQQNQGKKSASFFSALCHGFFAFFKSYFLQRGFLGGQEGFIISLYKANTSFYKYLKLEEANRKDPCS